MYGFEGYSSWYKIDEIMKIHLNSFFIVKNICANIAKDDLQYLVTPTS